MSGCVQGTTNIINLNAARERLRFCNSYTRLPELIELWSLAYIESSDWLSLLGEEWSACDNINEHLDELMDTPLWEVFEGLHDRWYLMTASEIAEFHRLPDEIVVYRGCYASNKMGLSWSLERDVACRFPTLHRYRQAGQPLLVKARVKKADVAALKLERGEAEIIAARVAQISTSHIRS